MEQRGMAGLNLLADPTAGQTTSHPVLLPLPSRLVTNSHSHHSSSWIRGFHSSSSTHHLKAVSSLENIDVFVLCWVTKFPVWLWQDYLLTTKNSVRASLLAFSLGLE